MFAALQSHPWAYPVLEIVHICGIGMPPIPVGATVGILGFTFKEEKGEAILRAEYLYVDGKAYGLRSSPT